MKKNICCGIALCIATQAFAAGGKPPLGFFKQPVFPRTTDGGTTTFKYTLINNTPVTLPLTISAPTVSSGSISLSSSTCGATLASSAKCDLNYLFTAPTNSSSTPLDITGSFQIAYNGRYPLTDTSIRFIVPKDAPEFTEQPVFSPPITVPSAGTDTLRYAVKNNLSTTITSVSFSPTVTAGTIVANGGTCGSSIAGSTTCTKTFLFTAPANLGSTDISVTGTMTFNYTDTGGAKTLAGDNLAFSVTPAPKASLTVLEHSLMFPNRDFGNSASYNGSITISNNGTVNISSITRATSGVTFVSTTCSFPLTPGSNCTQTYSSAIPITTGSTVQLTPNDSSGAGNAVTVPVSGLGVIALAPPTDTSVGLTLANGCTDTTNDGGLVMITNNSNEPIANISINASGLSGTTITNPTFSEDNNVYCNGQQLAPNGYCEFRAASSTTTTGEIDIFGQLVTSHTTTHHYELQAKVVAAASPFNYTVSTNLSNGGFIFVADNTCNLVQVWDWKSPNQGGDTWANAVNTCSGSIHSFQDWRLTDVGPTPTYSSSALTPLTGEYNVYKGQAQTESVDLGGAWLFPFSTQNAWQQQSDSQMTAVAKSEVSGSYAFCVRAFTTNANGS